MIRTSRLQLLFRLGIGVAVVLLIAAAVMLLLRKGQYDQLIGDYEATRQAAALIEQYARTGEVPDLPEEVTGFGLYGPTGNPVFAVGTAPGIILPPREGLEVVRTDDTLRLIRLLGGGLNPAAQRGQHRMLSMPINQQFVLLDYDLSASVRRQRLENAALIGSGTLILGVLVLIVVLYRRLQREQRDQENDRRLAQLGQAARTLAHEIRNPLTAAKMQTALLRREMGIGERDNEDSEHPASKRLDVLDEELARIKGLTDQVREFLKSGSGNPERVALGRAVREVADRLPFEVRVATPESEVFVHMDGDRLRSICGNLIHNAHEATLSGDPVDVVVTRRRDRVELRVADRGTGIPDDMVDQIFDPFFTTKEHGSGVGLAITRRFIEEASGRIEARPRAGGGTEMIIVLPEDS